MPYQIQLDNYNDILCFYCNAKCCAEQLMADLHDKFAYGLVEDKECEMMKLWNLQNKINILGNYYPEGTVINAGSNAWAVFNYTSGSYITTIVIGSVTITVNAVKTASQLITLINANTFYSIITSSNAETGVVQIYIESPSCTGYAVVINTLVEDVPTPIDVNVNGGCCQVIAPAPCLSDQMVMKLIGQINDSCSDC